MVPFYDYAFLKVKHCPLLFVLLLTFGCHNNAHLRTQKIVEKKEKSLLTKISALKVNLKKRKKFKEKYKMRKKNERSFR